MTQMAFHCTFYSVIAYSFCKQMANCENWQAAYRATVVATSLILTNLLQLDEIDKFDATYLPSCNKPVKLTTYNKSAAYLAVQKTDTFCQGKQDNVCC